MTPVHRSLAKPVLALDLAGEMQTVRSELANQHARIARTLVKEGPLRVTLIGVKPGGTLREHVAEGPITIHVLEGAIVLHASGETHEMNVGDLAAVDGGVRHDVSSPNGGMFLLTLVALERSGV